ncbi:hypothetical protein PTTG_00696 [Puccinia triticina 1-1 BBBD Race 1]|uniref:HABP4_PAI-RBP1 domain-containing protein n=2 Tax=Puccinia triticina TaxID=208348 RepID=A0A0C4EIX9_PUCT1|nr:uncharacterized protein PtA15_3A83 [Puccinia triticina]OAV90204.1 hypothetical protein PTTG_00696 [Puccinia triticina 1-1 BBBD Race 1]WAQ82719.1 hypothetical protein PtA15_3A83 [Puccinia triticina]WAR53558.1 hypothetical protein PtB15_3B66 [Puccinia triticina]
MSTISSNPFALLSGGDSDDEGGATRSAAVKSTKAPVAVAPQPKKTIPGQQAKRDRGDYPSRGAPRKVYGGQSAGADTEVIGSKPAGQTEQGRDDRAERRGGARGGRGTRGRGAARGRGNGREERPDRHSATGTHDTDRKVASGWGAEEGKQELQAETEGFGDAKAALTPGDADEGWGAAAADDAAPATNGHAKNGDGADFREEEEEDKTKTFEEYLAEKASAANALPSLKKDVRKPNEGADDSQWKDAVKFVKGEEEEEVFFQPKEKKTTQTTKKVKEKTFIEVEPLGYRPSRAGGERGGRGRGRGRGDRDGERREFNGDRGAPRGRGGRGAKELNTEDANAFPSLS